MASHINSINKLFSQPHKLTQCDFILREVAERMTQRLNLIRMEPGWVLDAGCGRGADLPVLQEYYPAANFIGVDISYSLLHIGCRGAAGPYNKVRSWVRRVFSLLKSTATRDQPKGHTSASHLVNADFAHLPLKPDSLDMIWSNLALHWHLASDQVFLEWFRVLKSDGLVMFSCFGPDTFKEIRHAFRPVDQSARVLPFVDMHDLGDMLVHAGFTSPVMDMETLTLTYSSVAQLMSEVRAFGGNPLPNRRKGLMGKVAWQEGLNRLEQMRGNDDRVPLTLEVIYGHAFKPLEKQGHDGATVIHFDRLHKRSR